MGIAGNSGEDDRQLEQRYLQLSILLLLSLLSLLRVNLIPQGYTAYNRTVISNNDNNKRILIKVTIWSLIFTWSII